jgi:hypothetical protein
MQMRGRELERDTERGIERKRVRRNKERERAGKVGVDPMKYEPRDCRRRGNQDPIFRWINVGEAEGDFWRLGRKLPL